MPDGVLARGLAIACPMTMRTGRGPCTRDKGCGHDASVGRRLRVAQVHTATAETCSLTILGKEEGLGHPTKSRPRGPADGGQSDAMLNGGCEYENTSQEALTLQDYWE